LVVPEAHREARVLVRGILGEPAAAQALEGLALGEDVVPVGPLEVAPRARPKLAPGNPDHHDSLLLHIAFRSASRTPGARHFGVMASDFRPHYRCRRNV